MSAPGASEWQEVRLGSLLTRKSGRNRPDLPLLSVVRERGVIVRDVGSKKENHNFVPDDLSGYRVVARGDLVINKMKAWSGSLGVAPCDGLVSPAYFVFSLLIENERYAHYLLRNRTVVDEFARCSGGVRSGQWDLSLPAMKSIMVRTPDSDTQRVIVRYLDHAELRIAKAIDGKNNLVKLLEEKRKVAVEDIVLGRHAGHTMSETGLPWAGQMPAHWDLVPLRSLLRPRKRVVGNRHSEYSLLSLTLGGVILRDLSEMKGKFPASFDTYQEVRDGDFVMCLFDVEETPRTIGLSAMQGMITGAYDVFESLDPSASDYLYEFLLTVDREKRFQPLYRGLRKTVPRSSLLSIQVPLPPTNEREEIVKRVRTETSQLDSAVQSLRSEIALLKEYRTRLISDVVTGKIDVRKEAAKLPDIDPAELAAVLAGGAAGADEEEVADGDD